MLPPPPVLTIAGFDPSGGAGIQADLRTFAALGVFGASVVTVLTAQNSLGVQAVWPAGTEQITAQLEAVLGDYSLGAVKIGALGNTGNVAVIARVLSQAASPHVILDPVLFSSSGTPLLDAAGRDRLIDHLLPQVELVTPNWPEAAALTGLSVRDEASAVAAARRLIERGARAVLVKGGHSSNRARDLLLSRAGSPLWLEGRFVPGRNNPGELLRGDLSAGSGVHGTGCVLSAAIAARLAQGRDLVGAVRDAKRFVEAAIRGAVSPGHGRPCVEPIAGAELFSPEAGARHAERLTRLKGIYLITDSTLRPDRDAAAVAEAGFASGACAVQLREKRLATPELVTLARGLAERARAAGTLFIVNDRIDVALAADADGAHVGPDDMPPADARRLLGPARLLGVSVGTVEEARKAAPSASYFGVGAIFGSRTKADAGAAVHPARIAEIRTAVPDVPIVAIGGIEMSNIAGVAAAGADAAAVVSAVVTAPEMAAAVRELSERFRGSGP